MIQKFHEFTSINETQDFSVDFLYPKKFDPKADDIIIKYSKDLTKYLKVYHYQQGGPEKRYMGGYKEIAVDKDNNVIFGNIDESRFTIDKNQHFANWPYSLDDFHPTGGGGYPVKNNKTGKGGICNEKGEIKIEPEFDKVQPLGAPFDSVAGSLVDSKLGAGVVAQFKGKIDGLIHPQKGGDYVLAEGPSFNIHSDFSTTDNKDGFKYIICTKTGSTKYFYDDLVKKPLK